MKMTQKMLAEFLGTLWLVLGGCGSAVLAAAFPELGIGFVGVALAFGLTVLTMAFAIATFQVATSTRQSLSDSGPAAAFLLPSYCLISSPRWQGPLSAPPFSM
ncbi:Aquaporin Z 2 [Shewanella algae]|nr:hypothetical protein TUM3811_11310 [Shewanella algae]